MMNFIDLVGTTVSDFRDFGDYISFKSDDAVRGLHIVPSDDYDVEFCISTESGDDVTSYEISEVVYECESNENDIKCASDLDDCYESDSEYILTLFLYTACGNIVKILAIVDGNGILPPTLVLS